MIVPPFPDQKNRDIDFEMRNSDIPWLCVGTMFYGKYDAKYLRNTKVTYQGFGAASDGGLVENNIDVEAGKVSTLVVADAARVTRVKIRR